MPRTNMPVHVTGFSWIYPIEINQATLRQLIVLWKKLADKPQLCRDMDICAFLDKAETEAAEITVQEGQV